MPQQLVISNDKLKVTLSTVGAELQSVKHEGEERIWIGNPDFWGLHAPLLFPVCGALKGNTYNYEGNEYNMQMHGYVRFLEFYVENLSEHKVVFLHRSDEETLKTFPFRYELRVIYTICGSSIKIEYNIKNVENKKMYFSIGSHEAYNCPEGIEAYSVIFQMAEDLNYSIYNNGLLENTTENMGVGIKELPLKYEYFKNGALTFLNLKSKEFMLVNQNNGKTIKLKIDENPTAFTIWTIPGHPYICLEPWCGMSDFTDNYSDIKNKKGIIILPEHEQKNIMHCIDFA